MGYILKFHCNSCSYEFEWMFGPNALGYIYHCHRCGATKLIGWDEIPDNDSCNCGGAFHKDTTPFCPKCKCKDVEDIGGEENLTD